ncbi:ABC transporter substrate-binding protein [Garciella nitratireducens]|uniref:ABC transporter substrate-binding protein n=1 Tax=Garciella nitratireducens TaxID=218205 RepID=UPI0030810F85
MKRSMKKQFISLLLCITMLLPIFSACSTDATSESKGDEKGDKIELTFWHSMGGNGGEGVDHLVKKFNEENDQNIHVKAVYQGEYDDALTKLRSSASGKDVGADLVQVFELGTSYMIDSGLIKPMQEFIDVEGYDISQIEPNLAAYYTIDGKLNSMPFNSSTPLLYYNKDIFEKAGIKEAPSSLEELKEVAPALMEEGGAEMAISMSIYGWWLDQWMNKQGLDMWNNENGRAGKPTEVSFDDNGGMEKALTAWKDLYDEGYAPNVGRKGGTPEFVSGKSAMTFASTASLTQILDEVGEKFEVGTAYFPAVSEDDPQGVSIGGASLYAIDSGDEEKMNAVWEFVKFLISPESQAYWNQQTGYFPITTAAQEEKVFKDNIAEKPQFQTAIDQLHDSNPESQGALSPVYQESRQIMESEVENMLNGNVTPKQATKNMAEQIQAAMENYNLANKK